MWLCYKGNILLKNQHQQSISEMYTLIGTGETFDKPIIISQYFTNGR